MYTHPPTHPPYIVYFVAADHLHPMFYGVDEPIAQDHLRAVRDGQAHIIKVMLHEEYGEIIHATGAVDSNLNVTWQMPSDEAVLAIHASAIRDRAIRGL